MEILGIGYIILSFLFLHSSFLRLANIKLIENSSRNRDTKLFSRKVKAKEIFRCKLFLIWPILFIYDLVVFIKNK